MFTTFPPSYLSTDTPAWYNANPTVSQCASSTTPNFSPDGASQMANALGMGVTCDSHAMSGRASQSYSIANPKGVGYSSGYVSTGKSGSISSSTGCDNMALLYNQYQQAVDTANCIVNTTSASSSATTTQLNSINLQYCALCGGIDVNGNDCPPCPDNPSCADITQGNNVKSSLTSGMSVNDQIAIGNMIQSSLSQAVNNVQAASAAAGTTSTGSKNLTDVNTKLSSQTTNDQINNAVLDAVSSTTQNNQLNIICGTAATGMHCVGCSAISQSNAADVLVSNIINAGMTSGIQSADAATLFSTTSNSQTAVSTGVPVSYSNTTIFIVLAGIAGIISAVGMLGSSRSPPPPSSSNSSQISQANIYPQTP